ncbi:MAG: hypothetical protein ACOCUW_05670 [Gemmatimonadota bacterium]
MVTLHAGSAAGRPPPAGEPDQPITCGFCGAEFHEDRSQAACQACPLSRACGLVRCPHCGYENTRQPTWITKLKEWIR